MQNEDESHAIREEEGRNWENKQTQRPGKHQLAVEILAEILLFPGR